MILPVYLQNSVVLFDLRKKHLYIHRVCSILLLWVFAIAITPFSVFHNHQHEERECVVHEKSCTHQLHVGSHTEQCLVCAAHFEKNYTTSIQHFQVYLENRTVIRYYATASGFYTKLVGLALRGPPLS